MESKQQNDAALAAIQAMSSEEQKAILIEFARFKIKQHNNACTTVALLNMMEKSTDAEKELLKDLILLFNRIEILKAVI